MYTNKLIPQTLKPVGKISIKIVHLYKDELIQTVSIMGTRETWQGHKKTTWQPSHDTDTCVYFTVAS